MTIGHLSDVFPSISQDMAPDDWNEARKQEAVARIPPNDLNQLLKPAD